ncbi:hypothetical protein [Paraburkholderia saeva]|uniref:hypothetical protein n=1 Tax=Paraburkholderia saeva TaxID=2777537 RepID=UPI001E548CF1|nr:hypothetical protein [Paraburkholderia saeva]
MGNTLLSPLLVVALLMFTVLREQNAKDAFLHALVVSGFGIVCGASVFGPLFAFGAFDAHNDAFTYLVHGDWLQAHAFREPISPTSVTPLDTQVYMYQSQGFRMGGSFLLADLQALLNLRWSDEVYPALVTTAIAACCLTIGVPLSRHLRPLHRPIRLALLALPAFGFGGMVFGANFGFLPQSIGLALSAGLLFVVGPLLRWTVAGHNSSVDIAKASFPCAVLFSSAIFAYTEIGPFLVVAIVGSAFILALKFRAWRNLLMFIGISVGVSFIILNTELFRTYASLRTQTGAVVGSPVDWSLLGYVAHALGVHGGVWGAAFQWTTPESAGSIFFYLGLFLFGLVIAILAAGISTIWRTTTSGVLLPTVLVLVIFAVGILYFRYLTPSPFPKGVGQSWSQFKLAEWANPFMMALVLLAVINLRLKFSTSFRNIVLATFVIGFIGSALGGIVQKRPLMKYYSGITDLHQFYRDLRTTVWNICPRTAPVYLDLEGENLKFRQMAVLYLPDRELESDWKDDGYFSTLPPARSKQVPTVGSCVIERLGRNRWLREGTPVGPFRVGVFDGRGQVQITSTIGGYARESDGSNWWLWVPRKVSFELQPLPGSKGAPRTKLHFEYATRGKQTLTLVFRISDGSSQTLLLQSSGKEMTVFDEEIDVPPSKLTELSIETDGTPTPLAESDPRVAAWIIRNVTIEPASS